MMGPPGVKDKKKYKLDVQMRRVNWNKVTTHSFHVSESKWGMTFPDLLLF